MRVEWRGTERRDERIRKRVETRKKRGLAWIWYVKRKIVKGQQHNSETSGNRKGRNNN